MRRRGMGAGLALLAAAGAALAGTAARAQGEAQGFFLHDGDTVVFYGDSITEQQMYGRDIETYVATRFPKLHVKFLNSGWSGDKVTGGGGGDIELRLKRDVLPYRPTVVTVFLGMNDGNYSPYDEATFQTYARGLTHIVDELTQKLPGVRLTLLTPSQFDYAAKDRPPPPAGQTYQFRYPSADYNQTLLRYGAFVKQLGAQRHIPVADLNAPMVAATDTGRRADPKFALSADGVHPNEVGHLIMAAAVLQAWHAPAQVADVTLQPGKTVTVTTPLPWPAPDAAKAAFTVSPLPGSLDVFRAHLGRVTGDVAGSYALLADGQPVGTFTGSQLVAGVDLTQYPALPQNAQAQQVEGLVQTRVSTWHDFFKGKGTGIAKRSDVPSDAEVGALKTEDASLDPARTQAQAAAQPKPHTFELRPAPTPGP